MVRKLILLCLALASPALFAQEVPSYNGGPGTGSGGGISGATAGNTVVATASTTGTSSPNVVFADQQTGADFCAKLSAAITQAHTQWGSYKGTIDARGFTTGQACASNPLSALPSTGEAGLTILMPAVAVTTTVGWAASANDVFIIGPGTGGSGGLFAGASFPATTPIITFGTSSSISSGNRIENMRIDANTNTTYTVVLFQATQEFSGLIHVVVKGGDSASTTGDLVSCVNCDNMLFMDDELLAAGDNNGLSFTYNAGFTGSTNAQETNLIARMTFNNTGLHSGVSAINFGSSTGMAWSTVNTVHSEGYAHILGIASANSIGVDGADSTGTVPTTLITIASGAQASLRDIRDARATGSCTNVVTDANNSVTIACSAYSFGSQTSMPGYESGTANINALNLVGITGSTQCLQVSSTGAVTGTGSTCAAGGGDTITSPHSTLTVGGTTSNTTLDLVGAAGEIMAGATPALTYGPTLGAAGHTGSLALAGTTSGSSTMTAAATGQLGFGTTTAVADWELNGATYIDNVPASAGAVSFGASCASGTTTTCTIVNGGSLDPNGGVIWAGYGDTSNDGEFIHYSAASSTVLTIAASGRGYWGSTAATHGNTIPIQLVTYAHVATATTNPIEIHLQNGAVWVAPPVTGSNGAAGNIFATNGSIITLASLCMSASGNNKNCLFYNNSTDLSYQNSSNNSGLAAGANALQYNIATQAISTTATLTALTNVLTPQMPNNGTTAAAGTGGVLSSRCHIIWNQATGGTVAFAVHLSAAATRLDVTEVDYDGSGGIPLSSYVQPNVTASGTGAAIGTVTPSAFGTTFFSDFTLTLNPGTTNNQIIQMYAETSSSSDTLTIEPGSGCEAWK